MLFIRMFFLLVLSVSCQISENWEDSDSNKSPDSAPEKDDSGEGEESETRGWTSGGGETQSQTLNPWFLHNTPEVKYCIEIDEDNFSQHKLPKEVWAGRIKNVFKYWQAEFEFVENPNFYGSLLNKETNGQAVVSLGVSDKKFVYQESCDEETSLSFLLGVANDTQWQYMSSEYNDPIAAAVQTEYDSVNLRGKGFIYISPELGPKALKRKHTTANRWTHNSESKKRYFIFEKVVSHEIGHVLGLQHVDKTIMSPEFADRIVDENNPTKTHFGMAPYYNFARRFRNGFPELGGNIATTKSFKDKQVQYLSDAQWETLGLREPFEGLSIEISPIDWQLNVWGIYETDKAEPLMIAKSNFDIDSCILAFPRNNAQNSNSITVRLPEDQAVFDTDERILFANPVVEGITCSEFKPRENFLALDSGGDFRQSGVFMPYLKATFGRYEMTVNPYLSSGEEAFNVLGGLLWLPAPGQ